MTRLHVLIILTIVASVGAVAAVADALVVTDQERLEAFVEAVSGEVSGDRIDDALAYVQTGRAPLTFRAGPEEHYFDDRDADFARRARRALRPLLGTDAELVQQNIEIEGDHADVHLRVRTAGGVVNGSIELEKAGGRWLVTRAMLR